MFRAVLATPSCTAFHFESSTKTCRVLKSPYLYRDRTDNSKKDVYMQVSKWQLRGMIDIKSIIMLFSHNINHQLHIPQNVKTWFLILFLVDTTWTPWGNWDSWNYWTSSYSDCNYRSRYRYRTCPGSNPKGSSGQKPSKTVQYGGERDCGESYYEYDSDLLWCP